MNFARICSYYARIFLFAFTYLPIFLKIILAKSAHPWLSRSSQFNLIIIDLQKQKRLFGDHHLGNRSASLINTHRRAVNSGTKTAYVIVLDPFSARLWCASRKSVWPRETMVHEGRKTTVENISK